MKPEALHPLSSADAGVVAAGFALKGLVEAGIPAAFPFKTVIERAVIGGETGTGGAEAGASGAAKALQPHGLPDLRRDLSLVDALDTGTDIRGLGKLRGYPSLL